MRGDELDGGLVGQIVEGLADHDKGLDPRAVQSH